MPGWVAVGGSGAMVLDARSPVSLPLDRVPSAARFRLLRPLQPAPGLIVNSQMINLSA